MIGNLGQHFPIDQIKHEVAGGNVQAPPVQAGQTQALSNATVANIGGESVKGYGLDFNNNGQFDRNDGVLAFDMNNDGKMTGKEISESRAALNAFSGNQDLNGDGKVSSLEAAVADKMKEKFGKQFDTDGNGQLDQNELQGANARVLTDANNDGKFEVNNANNVQVNTPGGRGTGQITGVGNGQVGLAPAGQQGAPPCPGGHCTQAPMPAPGQGHATAPMDPHAQPPAASHVIPGLTPQQQATIPAMEHVSPLENSFMGPFGGG